MSDIANNFETSFIKFMKDVSLRTTNPQNGLWWNDNGVIKASSVAPSYTPSLSFSDLRNSQYLPIFEDF